jgi:thioredoxin 1
MTLLLCSCGGSVNSIAPPNDSWFAAQVTNQELPVLVDFGATWCGPCQALKPSLERLAEMHDSRLKVVPIDVDERPSLAEHYNVGPIPRLLLIHKGKVIASEAGLMDYPELESWVLSKLPSR